MNEVIKAIKSRRSIRTFKSEQIKDEELNAILEAAGYAPSAMNNQGWYFTALLNKEKLEEMNALIKTEMAKSSSEYIRNLGNSIKNVFYNAPAVVIVSCAQDAPFPTQSADTALSMQNIMLAAHSIGIGSCWIHAPAISSAAQPVKSFFTSLGIPENHNIYGSVALGYNSGNEPQAPPRKEGKSVIIR